MSSTLASRNAALACPAMISARPHWLGAIAPSDRPGVPTLGKSLWRRAGAVQRGSGIGGSLGWLAVVGDAVGVALGELQHVQDDRARDDQAEQDLGQAAGGVPVYGRGRDPGQAHSEDGQAPAGAEPAVDLLEGW